MTGHNWAGKELNFSVAREEYGSIHFHDDDVDDSRWEVDFEWDVPADQNSAFYAAKLTSGESDEDFVTFWVVPEVGQLTMSRS